MTQGEFLIAAWRDAERAYETARLAWNALPDPEARHASGIDLPALDNARGAAAKALLAEAAGRHHIEERSVIWLRLDGDGRWTIDSPTFDSYPLEGYEDGPLNSECEHGDELSDECEAVREAAQQVELPTAVELSDLLTANGIGTILNQGGTTE